MNTLRLTIAINDYEHVRDLLSGVVPVQGVELVPLTFSVEEIFFRFARFREFDVSELSLAKFVSLRSRGEDIVGIPVFPSRVFRHSAIFVRADDRIADPAGLAGKRIGIPEWTVTATVYARGFLSNDYGVPLQGVDWYRGGVNEVGRIEGIPFEVPPDIRCTTVSDRTLTEMLIAGDLDAIISAHPPTEFDAGTGEVRRIFDDHVAVEAAAYRETQVFPIMHTVAIRREIYDSNRWVATNLMEAFEESKRRSLERLDDATSSRLPLPWSYEAADRARAMFGADYWPYGIEPNRPTLDAFLRYCDQQGITDGPLPLEELFVPEALESFRV